MSILTKSTLFLLSFQSQVPLCFAELLLGIWFMSRKPVKPHLRWQMQPARDFIFNFNFA